MATFTWTPDFRSSQDKSPNIKEIKFGDGYSQRQANGININPREFNVSFNQRDIAEIDLIDAFLDTANGVDSFDWTPPRAAGSSKFICKEWKRSFENASYDSLTAKFIEVFEP
jgi:phage-related protein